MKPASSQVTCRLLVDKPAGGAWNMAVDELLVEQAAAAGRWTLRLYQWERPTLSLGYFQAHQLRAAHPPSAACPLVRRVSGGGAILHDRELTYCLAVPEEHPLATDAERLYRAVHGSLVEALGRLGIASNMNVVVAPSAIKPRPLVAGAPAADPAEEPFLCFQRHAPGDVLVQGSKVVGSAQRRRRGAILQHGSILLATSAAAPELPGIQELSGQDMPAKRMQSAWLNLFKARLGVRLACAELEPAEIAAAHRLEAEKFADPAWILRR
ncbi:MAG TPA: biotin/lipoate A/B protein ligase family protein [Pirellulales bacterium]